MSRDPEVASVELMSGIAGQASTEKPSAATKKHAIARLLAMSSQSIERESSLLQSVIKKATW